MVNAGIDIPDMDPMRNSQCMTYLPACRHLNCHVGEMVMELGTLVGIPNGGVIAIMENNTC